MRTKTARARGKVRAQYRWAYATSTLQEIGQNQHGWAYNMSWAYNTYSTVSFDHGGTLSCASMLLDCIVACGYSLQGATGITELTVKYAWSRPNLCHSVVTCTVTKESNRMCTTCAASQSHRSTHSMETFQRIHSRVVPYMAIALVRRIHYTGVWKCSRHGPWSLILHT